MARVWREGAAVLARGIVTEAAWLVGLPLGLAAAARLHARDSRLPACPPMLRGMTLSAPSPSPSPANAPARRSAEEQARLDAELTELIERRITFNQVLGLKVQALLPQLVLRFEMRPDLVGHDHYGRLHGGVISAALDALGGSALMVALGEKHPLDTAEQVMHRFLRIGTIDLRVDFLRPGLGRFFIAIAEITRLGGRVGSTQMRLHGDTGELIATGAASYIVS